MRTILNVVLWLLTTLVVSWAIEPAIEVMIGRDMPFRELWLLTLGLTLLIQVGSMAPEAKRRNPND